MSLDSLDIVFEDQLKDIYSAETQILKFMPKMVKAASAQPLKEALQEHARQTEGQLKRLDQIGSSLGVKLTGKKCKGVEGLLKESKEVADEKGEAPYVDIALVAAAQRVEHYEISAYGTARALAHQLGYQEISDLLQQTLQEESATDEKLTTLTKQDLLGTLMDEQKTADDIEVDEEEELEMDEEEDTGMLKEEVEELEDDEELASEPYEDEEEK